jgi:hypothetical protein
MAVSVAPLTTTVMNAVGRAHSGIASGINNAVARTASLLAVAAFGLVMSHTFNGTFDQRLAGANIPAKVARQIADQRIRLAGMKIPVAADEATRTALRSAIDDSFVAGFRRVMLIAAVLALLAALSAWIAFRGEDGEPMGGGAP